MSEERRMRTDRRASDIGPPDGWLERRLSAAEEAELSPEDFVKYFGAFAKVTTNTDYQLNQAAEVFDRVRDGY